MYSCIGIALCYVLLNFCVSCEENDKSLFPNLPIAPVNSQNELCQTESEMFLENLNNLTLWAYKMWDATAKSTTGSLQGNIFQLGHWEECLQARAPFNTQFCITIIKSNVSWMESHKDPFTLERDPFGSVLKRIHHSGDISQASRDSANIGWCVPASCSPQDLQDVLNDHLENSNTFLTKHNVTYSAMVLENMCQRQGEHKTFEWIDGIFCIIVAVFVFIIIIATVCEYRLENELTEKEKQNYQRHIGRRILMGFSARKNFLDLAKADEKNPALTVLYGLRTVSIFMIIMGHRFGTFTSGPVLNFNYVENEYRSPGGWFIFHGDLFVDTFFILSGILVTYGLLVQYKKKYIQPAFIIFLRYMRLTPLYAFVVFYYVTIFNYIGSGPLWKAIAYQESQDCRDNWWTNLLYVNNYVNDHHICMTQTWYLACDLHYFIIAICLIVIFKSNKKLAIALFTLCLLASVMIPFILTIVYMRPALLFFYPEFLTNPKQHPDFLLTYIKTHTRATPYFIGMIGGYIYYKLRDNEKQLSRFKSHSIAIISVILLFVGIATGAVFYDPYHEYDVIEAAAYAGFHRLSWSVGTIGLLLTASYGHTTLIQKVLSWSPFVPLSKLVYGAYLMHMSFHFRSLSMTPASQYFDYFNLISWTLGDIVLSLVSGLILCILIETPIRKLCKELFMNPHKTVSPPETIARQNRINTIGENTDSRL